MRRKVSFGVKKTRPWCHGGWQTLESLYCVVYNTLHSKVMEGPLRDPFVGGVGKVEKIKLLNTKKINFSHEAQKNTFTSIKNCSSSRENNIILTNIFYVTT